jgi:hypothetical protein
LPVSSWGFWAGALSNATEIHVNGPPHHPIMSDVSTYIYHDEKAKLYFGRWNSTANDIQYVLDIRQSTVLPPLMNMSSQVSGISKTEAKKLHPRVPRSPVGKNSINNNTVVLSRNISWYNSQEKLLAALPIP